jgi:quinol monooxygenase YgiN
LKCVHVCLPLARDHRLLFWRTFLRGRPRVVSWPVFCDEHRGRLICPLQKSDRRKLDLIVFSIQIVTLDESRATLFGTLSSMLGPTRVTPGCLDARLYSELDKHKSLLLIEEWQSRRQFERSLDAERINTIVAAIELSSEAPVVRIDAVDRQEGADILELHRSRSSGDHR